MGSHAVKHHLEAVLMTLALATPLRSEPAAVTGAFRVLLGNEPRAYREAMARALRASRPGIEFVALDPVELDVAVIEPRPTLVVCSALSRAIESYAQAWVLLYPDGLRLAIKRVGETQSLAGDLDLDGLLAFVDQVRGLLQV